jgi:uncharacterized membrane protein
MPDHGFALVVFVGAALMSWLFMRWAYKKLRRSHRKKFPAFRHGGLQVQISLVFAIVSITALIIMMSKIF